MKYYEQKKLGHRIKLVRQQAGLKQIELAEEMHISRDMLSRIENGKNTCAPEHLVYLCQRFHKSANYFFFGTEDIGYEHKSKSEIIKEVNQMLHMLPKQNAVFLHKVVKIMIEET